MANRLHSVCQCFTVYICSTFILYFLFLRIFALSVYRHSLTIKLRECG